MTPEHLYLLLGQLEDRIELAAILLHLLYHVRRALPAPTVLMLLHHLIPRLLCLLLHGLLVAVLVSQKVVERLLLLLHSVRPYDGRAVR